MMLLGIGLDPMGLPWLLTKGTKGLGCVTQWQSQCDSVTMNGTMDVPPKAYCVLRYAHYM